MIYDLHRHLWPESLLDALRERTEAPRLDDWTLCLADGDYAIQPDGYGLERCRGGRRSFPLQRRLPDCRSSQDD